MSGIFIGIGHDAETLSSDCSFRKNFHLQPDCISNQPKNWS